MTERKSVRPDQIFDAAARLGERFVGSFEGKTVSLQLNILPDYCEEVQIQGPGINATVRNLYETYESFGVQYTATGEIPENILEILSNLQPVNRK